MSEVLKGYLFGSIGSGDRNEAALIAIKEAVEIAGGEIVDPHVADMKEARKKREELGFVGLKIYDYARMDTASFGVGEISDPSIGVGRELERLLTTCVVPVLACRSKESTYRSALVEGDEDPNLEIFEYSSLGELVMKVVSFVKDLNSYE